ncbi:TonB-dependent receptor plug domain-containing protein [Pseudooceanicola aestuarii]|uniref:TonB-dependent receptor plug domain-containing protein n=1 Tax=Pseudooceanicola aestuarii TaxID=2697319 RepID=UPI0013D1905D|nr:TonB-dependent receptor [Pseudooceanicola aestuarii]
MTTHRGAARHLLSCTAIGLVFGTAPVSAQEGGPVYSLDPIEVEQRDIFFGAADRATTMYVADYELERARTGDMKDVFAGISSVSVGGALPLTQKIFLNGVDMLNLGVTIDEAPQNNRAFHHVTANAIDPGLLKQVRADATVAPADAGPYALAGSVVFETVDAEDILLGRDFGGNVRLSYSDNGSTGQAAVTLAGRQGDFTWLGYGKVAQGDDYENGAGAVMPGTSANLESYLGKLAYENADGHRIELSALRLRDDELRQFRANFGGLGGVNTNLRVYDTTRQSYSLSYENTQAQGLWDPKISLGYSESEVIVPDPYDSNGRSGTTSLTLENRFHLNGSDTVTAGLDLQERFGEYLSPLYGTDMRESSDNIGLFAQARMTPADRWRLSFGARYDHQVFTGTDGTELTNSGFSGNASAIYDVTDSFALRGGVSSVFGGIDIEDNYTYEARVPWVYGGLQASRAQNATLGFDWTMGALTLGGEVFVTRIDDARSADANFDFESRGYNLGATYDWASGFARFTLSHSDVTVNGSDAAGYEALDFGAPLGTVMALEIEQETGVRGLTVGGGLDVALDYDMPASAGATDLDGYEVVNLFVEYVPPSMQNLTLRAEVGNLFDRNYADRATYGGEYSSVDTLNEPGRTITLVAVSRF